MNKIQSRKIAQIDRKIWNLPLEDESVNVRFSKTCSKELETQQALTRAVSVLATRLPDMISEAKCFQREFPESNKKEVGKYIKNLYKMNKIIQSKQGLIFQCFKKAPKNRSDGGQEIVHMKALRHGSKIGLKRILVNTHPDISLLDLVNPENNAGVVAHELSHLVGTTDVVWFVYRGKLLGPNVPDLVDWNNSADHYNYFTHYKFHIGSKSCND